MLSDVMWARTSSRESETALSGREGDELRGVV